MVLEINRGVIRDCLYHETSVKLPTHLSNTCRFTPPSEVGIDFFAGSKAPRKEHQHRSPKNVR